MGCVVSLAYHPICPQENENPNFQLNVSVCKPEFIFCNFAEELMWIETVGRYLAGKDMIIE